MTDQHQEDKEGTHGSGDHNHRQENTNVVYHADDNYTNNDGDSNTQNPDDDTNPDVPGALESSCSGRVMWNDKDVYGNIIPSNVAAMQTVWNFRKKSFLRKRGVGRGILRFYYKISPDASKFLLAHPKIKAVIRATLNVVAIKPLRVMGY